MNDVRGVPREGGKVRSRTPKAENDFGLSDITSMQATNYFGRSGSPLSLRLPDAKQVWNSSFLVREITRLPLHPSPRLFSLMRGSI